MRKLALLTAVALLGGCSSLQPPPREARPEPVQAPAARQVPVARPAPAPRVATRQPRAVTIDNTSIESFRSTWQRLTASLSPAEKIDLEDAVARLAYARYPGWTDLPRNLRDSPIVPEMIRDQIDGLSYAEIVALSP